MASYTNIINSLKHSLNMFNGKTTIEQFKVFLVGVLVDASYHDNLTLPTSNGNIKAETTDRTGLFADTVREIIKHAQTPEECLIMLQAEKINNRGYRGA